MIHPDTELRFVSDAVGVGVFAKRLIPRGTITWVRDPFDKVLPDAEVASLAPQPAAIIDRYAWREPEGWILCWDHARYVNHDCDANCLGLGVQFEVAVRDIQPGEQLTDDYRTLGEFVDTFDCLCGSKACTGRVTPHDSHVMRPLWQARNDVAMAEIPLRDQPLMPWVRAIDLARIPGTPVAQRQASGGR